MALYDQNDLIDVDTPQGPMRLPASVASALGLSPAQPLAIDAGRKGGQTASPDPSGGGQAPVAQPIIGAAGSPAPAPAPSPTPAPPPSAGKYTLGPRGRSNIGVSVPGQQEVAAPAPLVTPGPVGTSATKQDVAAATPATPPAAPAPTTEADLRKFGVGGMLDSQLGAIDDQKKAGEAAANVEAAEQVGFAKAYEDRNAKIDDLLAQRAKDAEAKQAEIQSRITDYDAAVKKYETTKIDRSVDHPILAAISLALGAFGSAMKGSGENPALNVLFQQIDRKVQGQMADQAKLGQAASMKRGDIDLLRQKASDSTARYNLMIAGETQKAAGQVEAIGARSNSDIVKANAQVMAAQLREKAANHVGEAVMAQQAKDEKDRDFTQRVKEHRESLGVQYAGLNQSAKQFKMSLDEQIREHDLSRQDKLDELALGYAKLGQKDRAAAAKEQAANGVFDPTSGNAVLTAEGQKMVDQADAMEVKARSLPPDQAATMKSQAAQIRQQAEVDHGFRIEDKDIRRETVKSVGAGQKLIDTIERMKQKLATDPSSFDREGFAGLETDYESAKADWIELHKGKPSSREFQAIDPMFGSSPADMATRVAGRGKLLASLNHLQQSAISDTTTDLQANGYKGKWIPHTANSEDAQPLQGTTSVEAADAATPGVAAVYNPFGQQGIAAQAGRAASRAVFGGKDVSPQDAAENSGPATPTGLSTQDTNTVQQLARQYDKAPDAKREKILGQLRAYASSDRPSLANGVATLIRGENPALYKDLVAGLAPDRQQQFSIDTKATAQVIATSPVGDLRLAAISGDQASKAELARRAARGDKQAAKAILDVVQSIGASR